MADQLSTAPNIEKDLNELEKKLGELKTTYEQFFIGVERKEPTRLREQVTNLVRKYTGMPIQNTGHKFRYNTLVSRYNSYVAYWNRTLREIEEGIHKREQFKAKLHEETSQSKPVGDKASAEKAASKPGKADPMNEIYNQYISARKQTNESTQGITRDLLEGQLKKQMTALKEKFNCKRVTFKVVVEEGKAKIKAIPKND